LTEFSAHQEKPKFFPIEDQKMTIQGSKPAKSAVFWGKVTRTASNTAEKSPKILIKSSWKTLYWIFFP
jgi:hypothetical protein